jgi:hypothetical protein
MSNSTRIAGYSAALAAITTTVGKDLRVVALIGSLIWQRRKREAGLLAGHGQGQERRR